MLPVPFVVSLLVSNVPLFVVVTVYVIGEVDVVPGVLVTVTPGAAVGPV